MKQVKVYHGSLAKFESFDYSRIGLNGTNEGFGFYFTTSYDIARGYALRESESGYIYNITFKGLKSLDINKKTMAKNELKRFIIALGESYLCNWGDSSFENPKVILNRALDAEFDYAESDVDIICSILNGACISYEEGLNLLYKTLGYDSIIVNSPEWGIHKIYIALTHTAYTIDTIEEVKKESDN